MVVDLLENICNKHDWNFNEGEDYWQNILDLDDDTLIDFKDKKKHFLLYNFDIEPIYNEWGGKTETKYKMMIFFCVRSKISDKDKNYKRKNYLSPLQAEFDKFIQEFFCEEAWDFENLKMNDKLDQLDTNLDGFMVSITLVYNHNYEKNNL